MKPRWWRKLSASIRAWIAVPVSVGNRKLPLPMANAWELTLAYWMHRYTWGDNLVDHFLKNFPSEVPENLRRELLALEQTALASPDPLHALRLAMLDFGEMWKVMEHIYDTYSMGEEEEDLARRMESLLRAELDYIGQLSSAFAGEIGAAVIRRYTARNFRDRAYHDWWDVYVDRCYDNISEFKWDLAKQNETGKSDDSICNQWRERMASARAIAIESPIGVTQYPITWSAP